MRVVVVGGGIAGLATAHAAAQAGLKVTLVEREAHFCAHSSGRNAAIYRPLEARVAASALAVRSAELLDALFHGERRRWLHDCGLILSAPAQADLAPMLAVHAQVGGELQELDGDALGRKVPFAPGLKLAAALFLPGAGVLDVHAVCTRLEQGARDAGAELRRGAGVTRLVTSSGRVTGVELGSGETLHADAVVLAAGAWSRELAGDVDAALPLVPHRRHLVQLIGERKQDTSFPVVWHSAPEMYFRQEGSGVLASPCDHEPHAPGVPSTEEKVLRALGARLEILSPELATARVKTSWACLRTMSPDGNMVVGQDPRRPGLFWFSGLAGHGMSAGVAAADVLSDALLGRESRWRDALGVWRYL